MADVFISYSRADRERVGDLAAVLERFGYSVWWDVELRAGARFRHEIKRQLDQSRAVIVVWTSASITSDWVIEEAEEALHAGKLVPLREAALAVRELPIGGFRSAHTLVLGDENGLWHALQQLLGRNSDAPTVDLSDGVNGRQQIKPGRLLPHTPFRQFGANGSLGLMSATHAWALGDLVCDVGVERTISDGILIDARAFGDYGAELSQDLVSQFRRIINDTMVTPVELGAAVDNFRDGVLDEASYRDILQRHATWMIEPVVNSCNSALGTVIRDRPRFRGYCCPFLAVDYEHFGAEVWISWISAGDCVLLLYRDGGLIHLNADHSMGAWYDDMARAGRISWAEARSAPDRGAQRSGLTGGPIPIIDKSAEPVSLHHGDIVLMATQAINHMSGDDVASIIHGNAAGGPERVVHGLLTALAERGAERKQTAVLAREIL